MTTPSYGIRGSLLTEIEDEASRGEISGERLAELARAHDVSLSTVQSLYTFYFPHGAEAKIRVCNGLPCVLRGTRKAMDEFDASGRGCGTVSCLGYCAKAPVVWNEGRYYSYTPNGLEEIEESKLEYVEANVQRLPQYRSVGGYAALERFLGEKDKLLLLGVLEDAFLRGMGGAGFPVHLKWKAVVNSKTPDRIVVVNGHEGEPGTFKDRLIMEREPHRLLEGALIAAITVGAQHVVLALRSEYANATSVLGQSIAELKDHSRVAGFERQLPGITLRSLGGSYITGEETALFEAMEGKRSEPRLRPPFPAEVGLYGKPTLVQNVETLASIPRLLAEHYGNAGKGTIIKYYCLTGDVQRPGAYRESIGITAASLLERDGETSVQGLKAFLTGGLSGGLLPASKLDVALDFDAVKKEGCGLGTGAIMPIGEDRCIVEVLQTISDFFAAESCGKCVPCRLGTVKLASLMHSLREGDATEEELHAGTTLVGLMQETSFCALGQAAGKSFLDAMKYFEGEIVAHTRGDCPAHVCHTGGE